MRTRAHLLVCFLVLLPSCVHSMTEGDIARRLSLASPIVLAIVGYLPLALIATYTLIVLVTRRSLSSRVRVAGAIAAIMLAKPDRPLHPRSPSPLPTLPRGRRPAKAPPPRSSHWDACLPPGSSLGDPSLSRSQFGALRPPSRSAEAASRGVVYSTAGCLSANVSGPI